MAIFHSYVKLPEGIWRSQLRYSPAGARVDSWRWRLSASWSQCPRGIGHGENRIVTNHEHPWAPGVDMHLSSELRWCIGWSFGFYWLPADAEESHVPGTLEIIKTHSWRHGDQMCALRPAWKPVKIQWHVCTCSYPPIIKHDNGKYTSHRCCSHKNLDL